LTRISVDIEACYADYRAATIAHRRQTRQHTIAFVTTTVAFLAMLMYFMVRYDKPGVIELVVLPAAYLSILALLLTAGRWTAWWQWHAAKRLPGAAGTIRAVYTDDGAEVTKLHSHIITKWSAFSHYIEGPETFLLYYSVQRYVYLPKRCLTPADVSVFRELVAKQIRLTCYQPPQAPGFPVEASSVSVIEAAADPDDSRAQSGDPS
jgi:hypothetical protein